MPFITMAQAANNAPEMATIFRSEGKIYVVIGVLSVIFACLVVYLVYIDVRVRRLEKKD